VTATDAHEAQAPAPAPPAATAETPSPLQLAVLLGLAVVVGLLATLGSVVFMVISHGITLLMWTNIPDAANWHTPPGWYVIAVPTVGGALVAAALLLPGKGGHAAVKGLSMEPLRLSELPSALLAALATLGFGLVLGPEAPLLAIGLTTGLVASRAIAQRGPSLGRVLAIAGAFAAISSVLGGPLATALMLFEIVAQSGAVPAAQLVNVLVPGLVAAGAGALLFTGIDSWPGVHETVLSLPKLPNYPTVRLADLGWVFVVSIAIALIVAFARRASVELAARVSSRRVLVVLLIGGFIVGLAAVVFRAITHDSVDFILFSGENSMGSYVAETSAGVLAWVILFKGIAYAVSLGAGFRGGPTFPAIALGIAGGVCASIVLPGFDLTPAVVAGVAAGAAAGLRLAFFGALIAVLMAGPAAPQTATFAILASVIGWIVATAFERRASQPAPD
jgi:H+/Cl- antiporter ClcA